METILVVDDSVINLKAIRRLLTDKYRVIAVNSAEDAFRFLENEIPDLILLDILMPKMDGFEMMKLLKEDVRYKNIAVIFLTADNDKEKELQGFRLGAMDFIIKPFEPDIVLSRIAKTLELEKLRHNLEKEVRLKTKEIENITLQSLMAVANTVDSKDRYTKGHSVKVAKLSVEIGRRLGWDEDRILNLHYLALLHDIGKIGMPDTLFNKLGQYTREEHDLMNRHTIIGAEILEGISIENADYGAKYHHERYDGTGYNEGLKGNKIPIEARIIAVADAYDAMACDRSYRKRKHPEEIINELRNNKGTQFDPQITDIFIEMIEDGFVNQAINFDVETSELGIACESTNLLQKVMTEYAVKANVEASKDPLTGLWNRKYTTQTVNTILNEPESKGTALMMDIDNFKGINDRYGHILGDEILINIAKTIQRRVRQNDIACRIGGDEFFLFINGLTDVHDIKEFVSRCIRELNDNVRYPDNSRGVCASIGIAIAPKDGMTFENLYENADKALYYAKNNGKNTYHFYNNETEICTEDSIKEDLNYIRQMLKEEEPIKGSYYVEYEGFKNISRFIRRSVERQVREVVYILFTVTSSNGRVPPIDKIQPLIDLLEETIKESLRIGDVATRYSSTQMVVILMDSNEENARMVAGRIFSDFMKRIDGEDNIELHYDVQQIEQSKQTGN